MEAPPSDPGTSLMLAWQAGDDAAFDRLVESYSAGAYALCTRFLGDVPGREDLVQEAFIRIVRARDRYQPTAQFSTWLYRIVYNLCANFRDRKREMLSLEGVSRSSEERRSRELPDTSVREPAESLAANDVVGAVRAAIAALPDNQRMALLLSKYDELSHAEIAVVLDSSEKAIKSLVHRARENLRKTLAPWLEEELL